MIHEFIYVQIVMYTGSVHMPTSLAARFIVGFFWFFCTVLVATYSGNLVAFLAIAKTEPPFTTVEELSLQQEYVVGTVGGTIWEEMLQVRSWVTPSPKLVSPEVQTDS